MAGTIDFDPLGQSLAENATAVGVFRVVSNEPGEAQFTLAPNVRCEQIQRREGAVPSTAQFSYFLDIVAQVQGWPTQFEQIFPINAPPSPYIFRADDEIAVVAQLPDGTYRGLFHGFAQGPQIDVTGEGQQITFVAQGVEVRLWDQPINFRRQRANSALASIDPEEMSGAGTYADIFAPCRFNPDRIPNCIPGAAPFEVTDDEEENEYPIFCDIALAKHFMDANTDRPSFWTVDKFAQYILAIYNDESFVDNPDFFTLTSLLQSRTPTGAFFDPNDPATFTSNPIPVADIDGTGHPWPEVLQSGLNPNGFAMVFRTEVAPEDGTLNDFIEIYRRDAAGPYDPKQIYLPTTGTDITDGIANAAALHLSWDYNNIKNAIEVEMEPFQLELSWILAPNFQPAGGDQTVAPAVAPTIPPTPPTGAAQFYKSNLDQAPATVRKKYREFVGGEGNGQYWSFGQSKFVNGEKDIHALYAPDPNRESVYEGPKTSAFYQPLKTLVAKDQNGKPRKAILEVLRNPAPVPGGIPFGSTRLDPDFDGLHFANTTGNVTDTRQYWENVDDGWELLDDRIGINITVENPDDWHINKRGTIIRAITGCASTLPEDVPAQFTLRLTVVAELPERVPVFEGMRSASPTIFPRWGLVDRQDQFKIQAQGHHEFDMLAPVANTKITYPHDDYDDAEHEGVAIRSRHEFPTLAGSVTIPELSFAYQIADRIQLVYGRNASLAANVGDTQESPTYPYVVGVTWDFTGNHQHTILELSDHRLSRDRG